MKNPKMTYPKGSEGDKILELAKKTTANGPCKIEAYFYTPTQMIFGFTFERDAKNWVNVLKKEGFEAVLAGNNGLAVYNVSVIFQS